jgi:hypothetical protein
LKEFILKSTRLSSLVVVALCASAQADILYGINRFFDPMIYRIDTDAGSAQALAPLINNLSSLAADDRGNLLGLSVGELVSVNTATGALTAQTGVLRDRTAKITFRQADRQFFGLTWDFTNQTSEIYTFNPETGETTTIASVLGFEDEPMFSGVTDLQFDIDGTAYVTARFTDNDFPNDSFSIYEIDLNTGETSNSRFLSFDGKDTTALTTALAAKSDGGFWGSFQNDFFFSNFGAIDLDTFDLFDETSVDTLTIDGLSPDIFRSLTLVVPAPGGAGVFALVLLGYRRRR